MAASALNKRRKLDLLLARIVLALAGLVAAGALAVAAIAPELAQRAAVQAAPAPAKAAADGPQQSLDVQRNLDIGREVQAAVEQAERARARAEVLGAEGREVLARAQALVRDRPDEIVRQRTPQGDLYLGMAQAGAPEGYGLVRRASGGLAASFFIAGESRGVGASCARQDCVGEYYFGDYRHGEPTGFGVGGAADGSVYRGEFKSGAPHGYGEYRFADGATYRGGFAAGARQGFGVLTLPDGRVEAGFWSANALSIAGPASLAAALAAPPAAPENEAPAAQASPEPSAIKPRTP